MDRVGRLLGSNHRVNKRGICITVVILGSVIGCALLAYSAFALPKANATLQQVVFVFRHGDRTPTETYPKDPYLNYSWEDGWGALTKVLPTYFVSRNYPLLSESSKGMLQLYKLGQWIREEYGYITGSRYLSSNTLVRSSYADRCIMSAQALLAGLYPPAPDQIFVSGLLWRPAPVHSIPSDLDKMIVVKAPCPRLSEALMEAYVNESIKTGAKYATYYRELSEYTGKNISTITDVEFLYNTLEIEDLEGLNLPEWTKKFYNQEMRDIAAKSLSIFTSNTLQQRLRGGPLLKEIIERMKDTRRTKGYKKAYFYSAHDITLVNLLRTMGFTTELFKPDYGAMIIFELLLINGGTEQEVKVKYLNNTESSVAHTLKIPKCNDPCSLPSLIDAWRDVIPDDWDAECRL